MKQTITSCSSTSGERKSERWENKLVNRLIVNRDGEARGCIECKIPMTRPTY